MLGEPANQPCERCSSTVDVQWESSRTCYYVPPPNFWQLLMEEQPDPNRDVALCRPCAEEHHSNWDAQWDEYYAGLL